MAADQVGFLVSDCHLVHHRATDLKTAPHVRLGERARFAMLRETLGPLHAALFAESNPNPLKAALAQFGFCTVEMRLPLTRASVATQQQLLLLSVMVAIMQAQQHAAHRPTMALAS